MRILFICGSLEPGSDGVGDYTRRLAMELIKHDHEVAALALNDQFIVDQINHIEIVENIELQVYRIPSKWNTDRRFKIANKWIDNFNPKWLSLQFVPFSFNPKGLPWRLSKHLSKFTKGRSWHIMFHELWVGMEEKSTLKHIIWGEIQKRLIQKLIKTLKPSLINTQTKLYQIQLAKLGFNAEHLPLFSNIPISINLKNKKVSNNNKIIFVNFGTIHPTVPIENFAQEAGQYAKKTGVQIDLILVGRCGIEQERWEQVWKSAGLNISILGEQPLELISEVFSASTFGITTTALPLIEKSGSVAAMHEHNLPVICVSNVWHPRGIINLPVSSGIIEYSYGNFQSCIKKYSNLYSTNHTEVSKVSKQLVKSLTLSSNVF